ncbi:unnamed protein product [Sphagnum troendelagicum]|uniref:Secreted protein n=1 Tax=Sphagnum troendelagicum TaxID=128251 RepID=A0ABP0UAU1_9BRYO
MKWSTIWPILLLNDLYVTTLSDTVQRAAYDINDTREIAVCKQNNTIDSRMERKQNNTRETAECHGTQQYKRERRQNAKETEQYNRDNTRYFLFRDRKICGEAGTCSLQVHNVQAMRACGH